MNLRRWSVILLFGAAVSFTRGSLVNWAAIRDSLGEVEPWLRPKWLEARGLTRDYLEQCSWRPTTDSGLRCVGRWSYGPSVRVSLRVTSNDTIVCLARGSGASLIRFRSQDSLTLQLLSDINCNGLVSRAIIRDTLVFCGMKEGGTGAEVWDVGDLSSPHRLSYVYLPSVMDIAVKDPFLYSIGYQQDSLRVFNVADPSNPVQVGACADSGINGMCVAGNYCYLADQYGLYVVDVSNPSNPHRVASVGGYEALSVTVRDTLCYVGTYNGSDFVLRVYDVKNPAAPVPVGSLSGIEAHDIYLPPTCDTVLYTPKLHVINIANPASPKQIGFVDCPGWDYGVVVVPALGHALVADYFKGTVAVNISDPATPLVDTAAYAGDRALDITIDNGKAYLASYHAGLQVLDVSDPTRPSYLGCYDTAGTAGVVPSATAKDSFAYASWPAPRLLSIDVTDPVRPFRAAGCGAMFNPPEDMVARDSFVYCAEMNRFQIVNVARPREPALVGSCVSNDGTYFGLVIQDTLAYIAGGPSLQVVSISDPANPHVVGNGGQPSTGVAVRDTLVYIPYPYDTLFVYSVADPTQLRLLSATPAGVWPWDVALAESTAAVATAYGLEAFSLENPAQPRLRAAISTPHGPRRVVYSAPYFYTAMWEAGVGIYSAESLGVQEQASSGVMQARLVVVPDPVRYKCRLSLGATSAREACLRDVAGRMVPAVVVRDEAGQGLSLDLSRLAAGVYFVEVKIDRRISSAKIVKQ